MFKRLKRVKEFSHKLRVWLPILWKDVDFDYHGIYVMLHQKLKEMEEFHRSEDAWAKYATKTADEIKIAKNLAKRLADESHLENATFWHDKKYENNEYNIFENVEDVGNGYSRLIPDPDKERSRSFSKACADSEYSQKQDREMLFHYMCKHIEKWWD